jgi:hypothetical protein
MWNTDCVGLALPDETRGRPQKFRVVIGSGTLPVTKSLVDPKTGGKTAMLTSSAPVGTFKITVTGATFMTEGVVPGDILVIASDTAVGGTANNGSFTISAVISETVLEVDSAFPSAKSFEPDTGVTKATFTIGTKRPTATATAAVTAAKSDLFLTFQDDTGTFLSSNLQAGDLLQLPADFGTNFSHPLITFVIASVLSENRLLIANHGRDTSTTQNELPHGVKRTGGALVPTDGTLHYQIARTLTKDGQVTALVALAQSFRSRRTILVWPDIIDVAGVVDGTSQPGYYLSCAVGGMTAGLPPHQGFTFLGIAGVNRVYHSNTYFNDIQLTDLSNGGWYVFAQQTTSSLPYTIHQLTTDVSTLESGEFSVVKNFDFVAIFFADILQVFLGSYNVTTDTLTLIRGALEIGGETLLLRTYARIGAPLTAFQVMDLFVSPIAADRVVTHLSVGLPKPLNNIELHLVA